MKTQHYLIAAGAIALVAYLATRKSTRSASSAAIATRSDMDAVRYRQQLFSEVPPDFWV